MFSITATTLTQEHKVSYPKPVHRYSLHLLNLNTSTNPHVDNVPCPPPRCIRNPYVLKIDYIFEEYHQLLLEQWKIGWDNFLHGGKNQKYGKFINVTMKKLSSTLIVP